MSHYDRMDTGGYEVRPRRNILGYGALGAALLMMGGAVWVTRDGAGGACEPQPGALEEVYQRGGLSREEKLVMSEVWDPLVTAMHVNESHLTATPNTADGGVDWSFVLERNVPVVVHTHEADEFLTGQVVSVRVGEFGTDDMFRYEWDGIDEVSGEVRVDGETFDDSESGVAIHAAQDVVEGAVEQMPAC